MRAFHLVPPRALSRFCSRYICPWLLRLVPLSLLRDIRARMALAAMLPVTLVTLVLSGVFLSGRYDSRRACRKLPWNSVSLAKRRSIRWSSPWCMRIRRPKPCGAGRGRIFGWTRPQACTRPWRTHSGTPSEITPDKARERQGQEELKMVFPGCDVSMDNYGTQQLEIVQVPDLHQVMVQQECNIVIV
ncbi:hypothetical protein P3G55_25610, partial [Leptospira sp. 96542]|nr:hypothetical protein [Leptospira sp. 96542]